MTVRRIIANLKAADPRAGIAFYKDLLGLDLVMDHGWILTFGSNDTMAVQVSVAAGGGSGTPLPDISVEVDDVDDVLTRARSMGLKIAYGPADEPWGVRRFYVRDPFGHLVNILSHRD